MEGTQAEHPAGGTGSDPIGFATWPTPFADAPVEMLDVACPQGGRVVARVRVCGTGAVFRIAVSQVTAMRLLDEGGLIALWQRTAALGGRPGQTTFRVRNHGWARESALCFLPSDGWSHVIATDDDCLEVVCQGTPTITAEAALP